MISAPLTTAQTTDETSHHRDVLNDFVDLGHELARLVVDQAKANTLPATDAAIAFAHVTRSVRRCILLIRKLAEPVRTIDRIAARKRIIRVVEDNIQRHAEASEAETLHGELQDRLDAPDLEDEIGDRPIDDIITDIVRDLGLAHLPDNHPWKRRTPADIAELCARAKQQVENVGTTTLSRGPEGEVAKLPMAASRPLERHRRESPLAFPSPLNENSTKADRRR